MCCRCFFSSPLCFSLNQWVVSVLPPLWEFGRSTCGTCEAFLDRDLPEKLPWLEVQHLIPGFSHSSMVISWQVGRLGGRVGPVTVIYVWWVLWSSMWIRPPNPRCCQLLMKICQIPAILQWIFLKGSLGASKTPNISKLSLHDNLWRFTGKDGGRLYTFQCKRKQRNDTDVFI